MKKIIYALILSLVVVGGLVFANRESKNEPSDKPIQKALSEAEKKAELAKWETNPETIKFRKWEASPAGIKVHASMAKIRKSIQDFAIMEAIVSSLTLPAGSRLGYGIMVRINGEEYILTFEPANLGKDSLNVNTGLEQLYTLKVNDKIKIRSQFQSYAPKYSYPIVSADYLERDGKLLYKRVRKKGGC
ncbi:MAG: hypothetical protein CFE21_15240 [Bacteroidetes bacterium B1(2017)]|nr:MAG: hypothetical protein CFE21_15240 [Bacteroidetes bacterium B1(2017)]